jgi:hypothetical protein
LILERLRERLGVDDWEEWGLDAENPSPEILKEIEKEKELFNKENEL